MTSPHAQRRSRREQLTVSSRGQITLPASMRKHLGITPGDSVIVEESDGALQLKPAVVYELDLYSDEQIADWDAADQLSPQERNAILERLKHA